jgi:hypothetical protein
MTMLVKYIQGLCLFFRRDPNTDCNEVFVFLISFMMCLTYLSSLITLHSVLYPFRHLELDCNRVMVTFRSKEVYTYSLTSQLLLLLLFYIIYIIIWDAGFRMS